MNLLAPEGTRAKALFTLLNRSHSHSFPKVSELSNGLTAAAPAGVGTVALTPAIAKCFATASVDAWLRAVHSFLISCALTDVSPVWASAVGYYSSHYSIRALAHLLGYYCLYSKPLTVQLDLNAGAYSCNFARKNGAREHIAYWNLVSGTAPFKGDPLFPSNAASGLSDFSHRVRANYADHLQPHYKPFHPVDAQTTKARISKISKIAMTAPPIPNRESFPDLDSVQIVAYHRLVRYREVLDELLGTTSRFWNANRSPGFAEEFMNYQLVAPPTVTI